jgi:hypothetical protein
VGGDGDYLSTSYRSNRQRTCDWYVTGAKSFHPVTVSPCHILTQRLHLQSCKRQANGVRHQNLKMNNATAGCMGERIGTPDRIELVDQCTYMEFGGVDRYAKPASYRLVRHALGEKS